MCEFISWIEKKGQVYYLTYRDIYCTTQGKALRDYCKEPMDYIGHGAIRFFYGNFSGGMDSDCTDFSTPKNFPPEIVKAIKKGEFRGLGIGRELLMAEPRKAFDASMAEPHKAFDAAMAEPRKAYNAAMAEARKAYNASMAEPHKAYNASMAEAHKAYDAAMAEPRKAFDASMAEPHKAYNAAMAEPRKAFDAAMGVFWDLFRVKKNRNPLWR